MTPNLDGLTPDPANPDTWTHFWVIPTDGLPDANRRRTSLCSRFNLEVPEEVAFQGRVLRVTTDKVTVAFQLEHDGYVCPDCEMRARVMRLEAQVMLLFAGGPKPTAN